MAEYIGVDLGGTKIAAALISEKGEILKTNQIPTQASSGEKQVIKNIVGLIDSVMDYEVKGIGVGSPGPLDPIRGIIGKTQNLPFRNTRLKEILWKRFRTKVRIENDANVYALGEARFGAAQGLENVVVVTLGTGVGTGIIINGQIYRGNGNAGESGHITLDYKGIKRKGSKNTGEVELYLGAKGILKRARRIKIKDVRELHDLAKKGNSKAKAVWKETGHLLGVFLADLTYVLDPQAFVIGGNISQAYAYFGSAAKTTLKERLFFKPPAMLKTRLGAKAPLIGAASLVINKK